MPSASSLLANSMIGDSNALTADVNPDMEELTIVQTVNELKMKDERLATLQRDLKLIHEMTLMDDDEYMYSLYIKSAAFTNMEFLCSYLVNLYSTKYAELINAYPGVLPWLIFCVTMCRSRSEGRLRKMCSVDTVKSISLSQASAFKFVSRRRPAVDVATEDAESVKRARSNQVPHPFLKNSYYQTHRALFSIGRCANYCVPSDFASLFLSVSPGMVRLAISGSKDKSVVPGYRATLSRRVVCSLQSREINYTCYRVAYVDDLLATVAKVTGHPVNFDQLSIGIKMSMNSVKLLGTESELEPVKMSGSNLDPNMHYFCVIDNFQGSLAKARKDADGTMMKTRSLALRSYTNDRYEIKNEVFDPSDETLAKYTAILKNKEAELEQLYEEYERERDEKLNE